MVQVSAAEHHFWLKMLSEHGILIYDHLSPHERQWIRTTEDFINRYASLARDVSMGLPWSYEDALELCRQFRTYKLALQRLRLDNAIILNYTPPVFNGMINELDEYTRLLTALVAGREPEAMPVFHHLFLWLPDQVGHAYLLANDLSTVELHLIQRTEQFRAEFNALYLTAVQMAGLARSAGPDFPALVRHVQDVARHVRDFYMLVQEADLLYSQRSLVSKVTRVLLQHHFPESRYFLQKLAESEPRAVAETPELFTPPA